MKLIIVFTKIESHSDFNGQGTIQVSNFMKHVDEDFNSIGFDEYSHHFHRLLPSTPIKGNTFNTNEDNIKGIEPNHSEILLIQLIENLNNWSDEFKAGFIEYASKFNQVYISYHKGPNNGEDIRNGNHRLLEEFLEGKEIFYTEEHQHIDNDSQLYAFLARAIVDNQGVFAEESYNSLVDKLVSFIDPSTNDELEIILHSITNFRTNTLSEKGYSYMQKLIPDYNEMIKTEEGLKRIYDLLNKRAVEL